VARVEVGAKATDLYSALGVDRSATSDQIRQAYLGKIRQVHPDITGGPDEAAKSLNAAYNVLSDQDQRAAYDASLAGDECPWCGARVPSDAVDVHVMSHIAEAARNGCQVCGRQPARRFTFKANSGFILARQIHEIDGNLCATCVTGVFREMQAHNITRGPWGLISLFMMPIYLIGNWISYGNRRGLTTPKPFDQTFDKATGLGKPVFSRVPVWIVVALISFVGFSVFQSVEADQSGSTSSGSSSGSGFSNPDAGWVVGACADVEATGLVGLTPCSGLHDARIVATPISSTSCPIETDFYVDLTSGVACLVES